MFNLVTFNFAVRCFSSFFHERPSSKLRLIGNIIGPASQWVFLHWIAANKKLIGIMQQNLC